MAARERMKAQGSWAVHLSAPRFTRSPRGRRCSFLRGLCAKRLALPSPLPRSGCRSPARQRRRQVGAVRTQANANERESQGSRRIVAPFAPLCHPVSISASLSQPIRCDAPPPPAPPNPTGTTQRVAARRAEVVTASLPRSPSASRVRSLPLSPQTATHLHDLFLGSVDGCALLDGELAQQRWRTEDLGQAVAALERLVRHAASKARAGPGAGHNCSSDRGRAVRRTREGCGRCDGSVGVARSRPSPRPSASRARASAGRGGEEERGPGARARRRPRARVHGSAKAVRRAGVAATPLGVAPAPCRTSIPLPDVRPRRLRRSGGPLASASASSVPPSHVCRVGRCAGARFHAGPAALRGRSRSRVCSAGQLRPGQVQGRPAGAGPRGDRGCGRLAVPRQGPERQLPVEGVVGGPRCVWQASEGDYAPGACEMGERPSVGAVASRAGAAAANGRERPGGVLGERR